MFKPPSWQDAWVEGNKKQEEENKKRQAELAASPYAWNGEGLKIPPNDPSIARAKWESINPGIPFPEKEQ